jgi:hypothetical protein
MRRGDPPGDAGSGVLLMALSEGAARMALSCVVEAGDPDLNDGVERLRAESTWVCGWSRAA